MEDEKEKEKEKEQQQDNRNFYLDVLFGDWCYLNENTIHTQHQIASDLKHPNISRLFARAREDSKKVKEIVDAAYKDLGI
jgi:hypothetical protein